MSLILGLETSCDETAAAVVQRGVFVRSSVVWSQHELHERYAGVVPEIASRAHLERLTAVVSAALDDARCTLDQIDAVAVGNRPGLIGSLIVGVSAAKALAWSMGKPLIGIDHVRAHLWAASLIDPTHADHTESYSPPPPGRGPGGGQAGGASGHGGGHQPSGEASSAPPSPRPSPGGRGGEAEATADAATAFPALGLVVSGGHTTLYAISSPSQIERLGSTIDDAVGEAYDKAATILDAGYPGGPAVDRLAQRGNASAVEPLPRSMLDPQSLDFSFSGLKTALLYRVRGKPVGRGKSAIFERSASDLTDQQRADLAAAFQDAAVDAVIAKIARAIEHMTGVGQAPNALILGGGVSANSLLRRKADELGQQHGLPVHIPALRFCVDNAAMIAGLAHHELVAGRTDSLDLPAIATTAL